MSSVSGSGPVVPKGQPEQTTPVKETKGELLGKEIREYRSKNPITLFERIIHWVKGGEWVSRNDVAKALDAKFKELTKDLPVKLSEQDKTSLKKGIEDLKNILRELRGPLLTKEATKANISMISEDIRQVESKIRDTFMKEGEFATRASELKGKLNLEAKGKAKEADEATTFSKLPLNKRLERREELSNLRSQMGTKKTRNAERSSTNAEQSSTTTERSRTTEVKTPASSPKTDLHSRVRDLITKAYKEEGLEKSLGKHLGSNSSDNRRLRDFQNNPRAFSGENAERSIDELEKLLRKGFQQIGTEFPFEADIEQIRAQLNEYKTQT